VVSRVLALWLVTLILLPFSAPFSTCDLSSLFGSDSPYDESSDAFAPLGALTDTAASQALPVARIGSKVKFPVFADSGLPVPATERPRALPARSASVVHVIAAPLTVPLRI
jgi:hypothetical protein